MVFENVLKKMPCLGNPCNNSLLECFTKDVCLLKRFSFVFESCFESVVLCGFEIRQAFCFAS